MKRYKATLEFYYKSATTDQALGIADNIAYIVEGTDAQKIFNENQDETVYRDDFLNAVVCKITERGGKICCGRELDRNVYKKSDTSWLYRITFIWATKWFRISQLIFKNK